MAEETFKQIVEVEVNNDDAIQAVVEQQKAIDGLKSTISDLKKQQRELDTTTKEGAKAYDENAKMIVVNEAQLKTLNQTMNANKRIVEANNAGTNEQTGAYQRLSQQYTALAQKAKDMAVVYGTNSQATIKAQQEAKNLSDRLKEIDASVGQNQRNVGNYSGALEGTIGKIIEMIPALKGMGGAFGEMSSGIMASNGSTMALNGSMKLLSTNPLFLAITIIVNIFIKLKDAVQNNGQAMEALNRITAPAKLLMEVLGRAIERLANFVLKGVEQLQNMAIAIAKLLPFGEKYAEQAEKAIALKKEQQRLEEKYRQDIVDTAKDEQIIARNKLKIEERNKYSAQERLKFAEEVRDAENRIARGEMERARLAFTQFKEQMAQKGQTYKDLTKEQRDQYKNLEAEEIKAQTRLDIRLKEITAKEQEMRNAILAEEKALQAERNKIAEERKKKREADAEAEKQKTIKEQDKMLAEMELKQKMYNAKNRELTAETAKANFDFEKEQLDKKLQYGKVTQEEYNLLLLESQNKYADDTLKIVEAGIAKEKELAEKVKNQEAIDFANKLELAKGNFDLEFQLKAEQREMQRLAEIEAAKKVGADVELINEKYRQAEIQAENAKNDAKISMYSQAFGALASIAGENTQLSKGFASAQIAIDTYKGAMSAFANAGNPVVGAILAGAVVAKGAKAIKDVWKVKNGQKSVSGGGGGGNVNVSQGMAQRNAREMPSEAIQRTQKTEPTIVPVLVTNNLTEKIDTKVQVTNNASM